MHACVGRALVEANTCNRACDIGLEEHAVLTAVAVTTVDHAGYGAIRPQAAGADGRRWRRPRGRERPGNGDRKSTRLNSSHSQISYAVFCLKKKKKNTTHQFNKKKKKKTANTT